MIRRVRRPGFFLLLLNAPLLLAIGAPGQARAQPPTMERAPAPASLAKPQAAMTDGPAGDTVSAAPDDASGPAFKPAGTLTDPGPRPGGRPLHLVRNRSVDGLVRFYLQEKRGGVEVGLRRSGRYLAMIQRIFREEGVPPDLAYLAAVESNFNPHARSPAHAVGMWQFTAATARRFGLRIRRPWYDERIDPETSTRAAARLLAYLYDRYDNWPLALAAYNAGEARVNEAIDHARRRGRRADYWDLRLPRQTRGFVPAFLALATIMKAPDAHGLGNVQRDAPLPSQGVELKVSASLGELAHRLRIPTQALVERNPAWGRGVIPEVSADGPVRLWVPPGTAQQLLASLAAKPPKAIPWLVHTVREGDTASAIALRYGVRIRDLLALNHLGRHSLLEIGHRLLVPVAADTPVAKADERAPRFVPEPGDAPAVTQLRLHRVQTGESLWSISRQYGVRMADLRIWNQLSGTSLRPNQELLVYLPAN